MATVLEKHKLPKLKEEIWVVLLNKIRTLKHFPKPNFWSNSFTGEFFQICKEEIMPLLKLIIK